MGNEKKFKRRVGLICFCVILIGVAAFAIAGSLNPSSPPGSTMRTLAELYDRIAGIWNPNETLPLPEESKPQGKDIIHMRLTGETQGEIKGDCIVKGREDSIVIEDFSHSVISPRDAASGLPTGKRQHKPITITKRIDKSTPLLFNVLVNNENIKDLYLMFWRKSKTGEEVQYYTIHLINASISEITHGPRDLETISFCYQKIIWTYEDGGITSQDDWEAPNA